MGGLVQGHMVVICIWCALFVTSQFDIISMFLNQRFGELCWHSMHIFLHPPHYICRCTEYELSALQVRLSGKNKLNATTQQFITAKITGCALKQGNETHSSLRQRNFATTKSGCTKVSSNTGSWALKVCSWTDWRTPWFARSNFAKADKVRKKMFAFCDVWKSTGP